jgi:DNA repair exonuclease SbcCD ATPase subunit
VKEMRAEKDHLRARHAMAERDLEVGMDALKTKLASQSAELGRKTEALNRLKAEVTSRTERLAALEGKVAGFNDGSKDLLNELHEVRLAVKAAHAARQEAEATIDLMRADIAELTAAVESRSHLIDRQQHDIMALTAQLERISRAQPMVPPAEAEAAREATQQALRPQWQPQAAAPAAPETNGMQEPAAPTVSFEARLAAIRDDKPLRDLRPVPIEPRGIAIETATARQTAKQTARQTAKQAEQNPPTAEAGRRRATDIRYDEPLSTADLLELGKAMLRQPAKDGPPHRTH